MRLLLDECVPERFKEHIPGHEVHTTGQKGWSAKRNGELLRLMQDEEFDCLVTVDQNLEYQQNIQDLRIALIVIVARRNRLQEILPAAEKLLIVWRTLTRDRSSASPCKSIFAQLAERSSAAAAVLKDTNRTLGCGWCSNSCPRRR
jgi:hypothetical protein